MTFGAEETNQWVHATVTVLLIDCVTATLATGVTTVSLTDVILPISALQVRNCINGGPFSFPGV